MALPPDTKLLTQARWLGLYNHYNELNVPNGAMSIADNALINRDNVVEFRPGFDNYSNGLPTAKPLQMFSYGNYIYTHINGQLYYDDGTNNWRIVVGNTPLLSFPWGLALNGDDLYISNIGNSLVNVTIRKFNLISNSIITVSGDPLSAGFVDGFGPLSPSFSRFKFPNSVLGDTTPINGSSGNVYIVDGSKTIRRMHYPAQNVETVAGRAAAGGGGAVIDGIGTNAQFKEPWDICKTSTDLYVSELTQHVIRKISLADGSVTTFAGLAGVSGSTDGVGAAARFYAPQGLWTDGTYIYVCDSSNKTIRKIEIATANVTTLAGTAGASGSTDGVGAAARFSDPTFVYGDGDFLYVTDQTNCTIRKIDLVTVPGSVTTFAGTAGMIGYVDGIGPAAKFTFPRGITGRFGTLFVSEDYTIRSIDIASANVVTVAGVGGIPGDVDAVGVAARFDHVFQLWADYNGATLLIADSFNNKIKRMDVNTKSVTTIAGGTSPAPIYPDNGDGLNTSQNTISKSLSPLSLWNDSGRIFLTDAYPLSLLVGIRILNTSNNNLTTFAGYNQGNLDEIGSKAEFAGINGVCVAGDYVYVSDDIYHIIRRVNKYTAKSTTFAGLAGTSGSTDGIGAAARFKNPRGLWTDGTYLYVCDYGNNTIRKIDLAGVPGTVTTFAGTAGAAGNVDGIGAAARFNTPAYVTSDNIYLYVTQSAHNIRRVKISDQSVTTIAGTYGVSGYMDGAGLSARFNGPQNLVVNSTTIFVADSSNHIVRTIDKTSFNVQTLVGLPGVQGSANGTVLGLLNAPPG